MKTRRKHLFRLSLLVVCLLGLALLMRWCRHRPEEETGPIEGTDRQVPARRLVYRTDSALLRGRAVVNYRYGQWHEIAAKMPYQSEHEQARRLYREREGREVLALSALMQIWLAPEYYMEAYLDPKTGQPWRAVRWKNQFPDILIDFPAPGLLLMTRARPSSDGVISRIGDYLQGSSADPKFTMRGPIPPIQAGENLVDLLTVFHRLEEKFTGDSGPPTQPFYLAAIRKGDSSIYAARFTPTGEEQLTLAVSGAELTRTAVRCDIILRYAVPVSLTSGDSLESLAAEYMPEKTRTEAVEVIRTIIGHQSLEEWNGTALAIPVSMTVYNRIFDRDNQFEGPFGLAESATVWVDRELGIPLRFECRLYGIEGSVVLSECDPQYLQRLME